MDKGFGGIRQSRFPSTNWSLRTSRDAVGSVESQNTLPRDRGLLQNTIGLNNANVMDVPPHSIWDMVELLPLETDTIVVSISVDLIKDGIEEMTLPSYAPIKKHSTNCKLIFY